MHMRSIMVNAYREKGKKRYHERRADLIAAKPKLASAICDLDVEVPFVRKSANSDVWQAPMCHPFREPCPARSVKMSRLDFKSAIGGSAKVKAALRKERLAFLNSLGRIAKKAKTNREAKVRAKALRVAKARARTLL